MSEMRVCKKCEQEKSMESFDVRKDTNKLRSACKECRKLEKKAWEKANRAKARLITKRWRSKNPEKCKDIRKEWVAKNLEKVREKVRRYDESNREKRRLAAKNLRDECRLSYVRWALSQGDGIKYPIEVLEVKQMQMKINRLLKEKQ